LTLHERLLSARRPGGYDPGDNLELAVKEAHGAEHNVGFSIEAYCGGGFAGQVYRARCVESQAASVQTGQVYAVKFFCTRSGMRRRFRDLLYWLGFQSPFPHQYNEDAVRTGLPLTRLLKVAFAKVFGTAAPINDFYGTFWDDHVGSYGEVTEWVAGYVTDPAPDDGIFVRRAQNRKALKAGRGARRECPLEIAKKHTFMDAVVSLCRQMGLEDLARQSYWWTGMSQANLLTRNASKGTARPEFVWVDRRPGLPGFILSPGDLPLFWRALRRWSMPPFDRIDFSKLRAWAAASGAAESAETDIAELEGLDTSYRRTQLDLLGNHFRLLTEASLRRAIARARIDYWHRSGRIDVSARERLSASGVRYLGALLLSLVPLFGRPLQKLISNRDWRRHMGRLLRDRDYRFAHFDDQRANNLKVWLIDGRTSEARAEAVLQSFRRYFWDLVCSAFPPVWQRFLAEPTFRLDCLKRLFTSPAKYVFVGSYRRQVNMDWMRTRTHEDLERGFVEPKAAEEFIRVSGDRAMQEYLTGILVTAAVKPTSELCYVLFWAWVVMQVDKLKTLGWWLAPLVAVVALISPSGTLRFAYCLSRLPFRRGVPFGTATLLAPFRALGDLAFFVQTAKTYPSFSGYLLTATACRLAEHFPVFGERGGLLSIWTVTVLLSWPASFRRWREWWQGQKKG